MDVSERIKADADERKTLDLLMLQERGSFCFSMGPADALFSCQARALSPTGMSRSEFPIVSASPAHSEAAEEFADVLFPRGCLTEAPRQFTKCLSTSATESAATRPRRFRRWTASHLTNPSRRATTSPKTPSQETSQTSSRSLSSNLQHAASPESPAVHPNDCRHTCLDAALG